MKLSSALLAISTVWACGQSYTFTDMGGSFSLLTDVAVDKAGNVYVADYGHNQIQKIASNGNVTTLAGSGGMGSADGTGTSAEFSNPVAVAVGTNGNVYVSDRGNHTIRKITPDGLVTTLAGSPGVIGGDDGNGPSASFRYTHGLSVDNAGNVFVADREGGTIRRITPAGDVTTIAGAYGIYGTVDGTNNDARFSFDSPSGVPVDNVGNVYVMDKNARIIRKITPTGTDWVTTTIAGSPGQAGSLDGTNGAARFNEPYNGMVDGAGNIYVADTGTGGNFGQTIRKITPIGTNWVVTTIAGSPGTVGSTLGTGAQTRFGHDAPFGVTVDSTGNLYVADYGNSRVLKGTLASPPPHITTIKFVSSNVQIDFTSSAADASSQFKLQSLGALGSTFSDVSPPATISQLGSGSFRAVTALNGGIQFYRVKK